MVRTLEEIRRERGGTPHGFVLMATGALPDDEKRAKAIVRDIKQAVDSILSEYEENNEGMEMTGLILRMETIDAYKEAGLPNAG